jgi:hypothetical protein
MGIIQFKDTLNEGFNSANPEHGIVNFITAHTVEMSRVWIDQQSLHHPRKTWHIVRQISEKACKFTRIRNGALCEVIMGCSVCPPECTQMP